MEPRAVISRAAASASRPGGRQPVVVEPVIRAHPLGGQRTSVTSGLACAQGAGQPRKPPLCLLELVEVGLRDLRRRQAGRERLELSAHEEGLPHALARQRPHAYPTIRLERHGPSAASRFSASRTGVRLTPYRSESLSWRSTSPGASSPETIASSISRAMSSALVPRPYISPAL